MRKPGGWTYSTVSSVTPSSGQRGTFVTISGTALLAGGSSVTQVKLAGVIVASVRYESQTEIVVVARDQTVFADLQGNVEITLNNNQRVVGDNMWTYKVAGSINSVAPIRGQYKTVVTVQGTNLFGHGTTIVAASIAGVAVHQIGLKNNTYVELVAGASGATRGDIVLVSDTNATVVLADGTARNSLPSGQWGVCCCGQYQQCVACYWTGEHARDD